MAGHGCSRAQTIQLPATPNLKEDIKQARSYFMRNLQVWPICPEAQKPWVLSSVPSTTIKTPHPVRLFYLHCPSYSSQHLEFDLSWFT